MAEPARRVVEQDTVLRNVDDETLARMVQSDLKSTDLERELASRLIHHKDNRRFCAECEKVMK